MPKAPQDGLNTASKAPKTPQEGYRKFPKKATDCHACREAYMFCIFAFYVLTASKTPQEAPQIAPRQPKRLPIEPSRRSMGAPGGPPHSFRKTYILSIFAVSVFTAYTTAQEALQGAPRRPILPKRAPRRSNGRPRLPK